MNKFRVVLEGTALSELDASLFQSHLMQELQKLRVVWSVTKLAVHEVAWLSMPERSLVGQKSKRKHWVENEK